MKSSAQLIIFLFATACYASSVYEVNTVGRTHSRHSNGPHMMVSDIYAAGEYFYGKESVEPMPQGIDPDNVPTLSVHYGLSDTCTEKICNMFYYALVSYCCAVC